VTDNKFPTYKALKVEAERHDVSIDFLRRKVRAGVLPHVRAGGRIRVKPEDVDSLLEAETKRAAQAK
jgi:excisionase family DNA binding protein